MRCDGNHASPQCADKECWRRAHLHHLVSHERDSSGSLTLGRTSCGLLIYNKYSCTRDWDMVDCEECLSERTLVA